MIRHLHQLKIIIFSLLFKKIRKLQAFIGIDNFTLPLKKFGDDHHDVFFGYYEISPFNINSSKLLANRLPQKKFSTSSNTPMEIGFYEIDRQPAIFHKISETKTWCSQQGCRLQWYSKVNDHQILYNTIVGDGHGCVIQDIETGDIVQSIQLPLYTVSPDGLWGLNLNFSRLHRLREGYGYCNFLDHTRSMSAPENDGIWLVDMFTGKDKLLFSIKEITNFKSLENMIGAEHYFNHILFNPSGKRFLFFHIWIKHKKRYTRLITCNLEGKERYVIVNEGHVSHYFWLDDRKLIAFATHANSGTGYYLYNDQTTVKEKIENKDLLLDGHPSISSAGVIVTDTYPNKWGEQALMLFFPEQNIIKNIGFFYSPPFLKGTLRCDLHPRWDQKGERICFDSAHQGNRAMYLVDVKDLLK
jgi:hypothetical protein